VKDYSSWPQKHSSVTSLRLDPLNPRIPSRDREFSQRELIAELVEHDAVYDLAKGIVEQGYWPLESLIGLKQDGKAIVLEGNRRLTALKLLLNPELAPTSHVLRFKKLGKTVPNEAVSKVRVLYAPTREDAAPFIMARHTRTQVERWSPIMQARFYAGLHREGITIDDMAKQYGVKAAEIRKNLRLDEAYKAACSIDLPSDVSAIVRNPRQFEISTLERIISSPAARKKLGIEFDSDGKMEGRVAPEDFKRSFSQIVRDIARRRIDTRSLNSASQIDSYLDKLKDGTPRSKGRFTTKDLAPTSPPSPDPGKQPPKTKKPKRSTRPSAALIPSDVHCRIDNQRIREIFGESRKLRVDAFPNACGVMLRLLLDVAVSDYMDRTGKMKLLKGNARNRDRPSTWSPTLNQMLRYLVNDSHLPLPGQAKRRLTTLVSDKHSLVSVDLLDAFAHNRFALPVDRELRSLWDTVAPLVALALDPELDGEAPAKPGKKARTRK